MARKNRQVEAAAPVSDAEKAFEQGDVKQARALSRGTPLFERTQPDPMALLAVGGVLVLIAIAAIFGIFHR